MLRIDERFLLLALARDISDKCRALGGVVAAQTRRAVSLAREMSFLEAPTDDTVPANDISRLRLRGVRVDGCPHSSDADMRHNTVRSRLLVSSDMRVGAVCLFCACTYCNMLFLRCSWRCSGAGRRFVACFRTAPCRFRDRNHRLCHSRFAKAQTRSSRSRGWGGRRLAPVGDRCFVCGGGVRDRCRCFCACDRRGPGRFCSQR